MRRPEQIVVVSPVLQPEQGVAVLGPPAGGLVGGHAAAVRAAGSPGRRSRSSLPARCSRSCAAPAGPAAASCRSRGRPDAHVAGADQQLVAGHFGVCGIVAQGSQEQLGHTGDHSGPAGRAPAGADARLGGFTARAASTSFPGVLRAGDLAGGEPDAQRGGTDQHRDTGHPQQRVGVAVAQRVELSRWSCPAPGPWSHPGRACARSARPGLPTQLPIGPPQVVDHQRHRRHRSDIARPDVGDRAPAAAPPRSPRYRVRPGRKAPPDRGSRAICVPASTRTAWPPAPGCPPR